jgi:hypothetical protein
MRGHLLNDNDAKRATVALGMQGAASCLHRAPFKLVRFHQPQLAWPLIGGDQPLDSPRSLLFHGDPVPDESRDVSAQFPDVVEELKAELEARIPIETLREVRRQKIRRLEDLLNQ